MSLQVYVDLDILYNIVRKLTQKYANTHKHTETILYVCTVCTAMDIYMYMYGFTHFRYNIASD